MISASHFSFLELFIAFVLILILNLTKIVEKTITWYWQRFAQDLQKDRLLYEQATLRVEFTSGVGIIEQLLYTYAFVSGFREFIGGVLLFKAFHGWLSTQDSREQIHPDARAKESLERFYAYAIGNFISLAYAILAYEVAHLLFR
jgi:hypothetical protein